MKNLSIPWGVFVGAFLYYTGLALLTVSGANLSGGFMAGSYGLPMFAYFALLTSRAIRAVASIELVTLEAPRAAAR